MKATDALSELRAMPPVFETREVAARLDISLSRASQVMQTLSGSGLAVRLRHGLWSLDEDLEPFVLPPYLTAPSPAYVSFWSALAHHGMIEQVPGQTFVASLGRSGRVTTAIGTYSIHHLAPKLFTGFVRFHGGGFVAIAEKALFDSVYLSASRGGRISLPELELPRGFSEAKLAEWTKLISSGQRRAVVSRGLERALANALRP